MGKKKLTPEEEAALSALRERLVLTVQFIQDRQEFPSGAELREIIESAAKKHDLRTLKLLAREIDAMAISLAPHEREGLEAVLLSRFGVDKEGERAVLQDKVIAVLRRGTIAGEKERRRLEEYADMLEVTGGDPAELATVRRLLSSA